MIIKVHKCRPKSHPFPILAWGIMIFQKSNPFKKDAWSHMSITFTGFTGSLRTVDMTSAGLGNKLHKLFKKKYTIVDSLAIQLNCKTEDFLMWLEDNEHKKYDRMQLIGMPLKILGITSKNKYGRDYDKLTCNELVLSVLKRFKGSDFGDPDNYDLLATWEIAKGYSNEVLDI